MASYPVLQQQPPTQKPEIQTEQFQITESKSETDIDGLFKELNSLIGLQRVKDEVRQLINFVKVQELSLP